MYLRGKHLSVCWQALAVSAGAAAPGRGQVNIPNLLAV